MINGQATELPGELTIAAALEWLGLSGRRLAVECNGDLIPRSAHSIHRLRDGDRLEIVQAIGGG